MALYVRLRTYQFSMFVKGKGVLELSGRDTESISPALPETISSLPISNPILTQQQSELLCVTWSLASDKHLQLLLISLKIKCELL